MATASHDFEPMAGMNTTPLIDVLLVLLVMMIITIPVMTHTVTIDLPQAGPAPAPRVAPHRLSIARDGTLAWDGAAISDAALTPLLEGVARGADAPILQMQTDPEARYERFDTILARVKRANIQRLGFIGHQPLPE